MNKGLDTTEDFLASAREHFQVSDVYDKGEDCLERHTQWAMILNDTLTWELSSKVFPNDISFKPSKGVKDLDQLYQDLIQSYITYKRSRNLTTSIGSVMSWLDDLETNHQKLKLPSFIKARFSDFFSVARRYFIQLVVIEEHMKKLAHANHPFASRISQETIFKEPKVQLVQGKEGVHAEMRLFSTHLLKKKKPSDYYGIAKLCCALCHYTFHQCQAEGIRTPETRGTHATLYKWPLPKAFYKDEHMKSLLGNALFTKYQKFNTKRRLESQKKGPQIDSKEVALEIISRLDMINSNKSLKKIRPNLRQLRGSSDHLPDNEIPPKASTKPSKELLESNTRGSL